jgi:phage terminase large subunit-like protein
MLGRMLDESMNGEMDEEPGRKVARNWPAQMLVINYEAPTNNPKDVEKIKLANPASWITTDYLTRQAANPELTESAFLQLHACVWAERQDAWLPAGSWEKLALEREVGDTPCVFGFDGSDTGDSTALVGCTMEETPHVFVIGVWQRPPKAVDWFVPRDEVEACLDAAVNRYNVQRLLCDPPGWRREIQEWSERYRDIYTVMFKTNQRKLATVACSRFHAAVITKSLTHDGDPDLAEHIGNAVVKETPEGNYITKDHKASQRKIDLAVAAVMAHYAAVDHKPSVYESRGVVTIA